MKRLVTSALIVAACALSAPAAASAATTTQLRTNAYELTTDKCFAMSSGCFGITLLSETSYYNPAAGFFSGSRRYRFKFGTWATRLNGAYYYCDTYVRNQNTASGLVQC